MIVFVDSSAFLKLFLEDEPGIDAMRAVIAFPGRSAVSRLTYVEVRSGLAAARRAGRLMAAAHRSAVTTFDEVWVAHDLIELDDDLTRRAGDLAEAYGLRTGDAVQLASALAMAPEGVTLVAWDGRLRAAASAAGLAVFPATA